MQPLTHEIINLILNEAEGYHQNINLSDQERFMYDIYDKNLLIFGTQAENLNNQTLKHEIVT